MITATGADDGGVDAFGEQTALRRRAAELAKTSSARRSEAVTLHSSLPHATALLSSSSTADSTVFSLATSCANGYGTPDILVPGDRRLNRASVSGDLMSGGRSRPTFAI